MTKGLTPALTNGSFDDGEEVGVVLGDPPPAVILGEDRKEGEGGEVGRDGVIREGSLGGLLGVMGVLVESALVVLLLLLLVVVVMLAPLTAPASRGDDDDEDDEIALLATNCGEEDASSLLLLLWVSSAESEEG